jgi:hypothetical protein
MLESSKADKRDFMAFLSADFAVLRAGEGCIVGNVVSVDGGVMLWCGIFGCCRYGMQVTMAPVDPTSLNYPLNIN